MDIRNKATLTFSSQATHSNVASASLLAIVHVMNWYTIFKATEKEKKKSSPGISIKGSCVSGSKYTSWQLGFARKEHMNRERKPWALLERDKAETKKASGSNCHSCTFPKMRCIPKHQKHPNRRCSFLKKPVL